MARKLRLEYPGACYHVINRGNYRQDVFATAGARAAFETCLFEACAKSGWLLHAFVVMSNHYHLAVETPEGNLVAGMQWLQATFANRFNKLRDERGHLFQGRYKSLLVEPGEALGQVCHYIHLNPVRAGLVTMARLKEYPNGSYWYGRRPASRPACLRVESALVAAGGLADTIAGWRAYEAYLTWQAEQGPAGRNAAYVTLSRGWALGTEDFKARLVHEHGVAALSRAWETTGAKEVRQMRWTDECKRCMQALGKTDTDLQQERKSAPWKVAIAAHLKTTTQASNCWLSERLQMGSAVAVSQYVGQLRRAGGDGRKWLERLTEILKT
jgi:REP element-mobilizing transposase RayT